jgi:hypothetical protein
MHQYLLGLKQQHGLQPKEGGKSCCIPAGFPDGLLVLGYQFGGGIKIAPG